MKISGEVPSRIDGVCSLAPGVHAFHRLTAAATSTKSLITCPQKLVPRNCCWCTAFRRPSEDRLKPVHQPSTKILTDIEAAVPPSLQALPKTKEAIPKNCLFKISNEQLFFSCAAYAGKPPTLLQPTTGRGWRVRGRLEQFG